MQATPKPWTHHHTHRLFHISMGLCFTFIAGMLCAGLIVTWQQVRADTVDLTANVGEINPGPTVVLNDTNNNPPYLAPPAPETPDEPKEESKLNFPTVSIEPEASLLMEKRIITLPGGKKTEVNVYNTSFPQFSGTTNIPDALIFLVINSSTVIHATTTADGNGYWHWTSSRPLPSGFHNVSITAQDPHDSRIRAVSSMDFFIQPFAHAPIDFPSPDVLVPAPGNNGNLFDVFVTIPQQYKELPPGDELIAQIKLINFGSPGNAVDVPVQYTIQDGAHRVISDSKETVAVSTQISLLKTFYISPSLQAGIYTLIVQAPTKDAIAIASDTFELKGNPVVALSGTTRINFTAVFNSLLVLFFLFIIIAYTEYNKVFSLSRAIKQVSEKDLNLAHN